MSPIESDTLDTLTTLHAGGLLEAGGEVGRDVSEDGDLSGDDRLVAAVPHVAGYSLDETRFRLVVEDVFPELPWNSSSAVSQGV